MTQEEKAKEIAEFSVYLSDFPHDKRSVEYGALKMAKWKDNEMKCFIKEIHRALDITDEHGYTISLQDLIARFEEFATKGE